uniref:Arc-like DNA binding domain-containing protein n=1 Tax=uncultured Thiotrichaceae bacterium TaxID=298394 RepID=A0A6S6UGD3_9GAMM|nr:MAG: Unknown protein [uncultured Thiotrichaceae bacterium]
MTQKDTRTDPQMKIRLPPELKKQIDKSAKKNLRTLNGEIVAMLQLAYELEGKTTSESTEETTRRIAREEIEKALDSRD